MGNNLVYMVFSEKPVLFFWGNPVFIITALPPAMTQGGRKKWGTSWGISVKPLLCVCPFQDTVRIPCKDVFIFFHVYSKTLTSVEGSERLGGTVL